MKMIIVALIFLTAGCIFGFFIGAVLAASRRADDYYNDYIVNTIHTEGDKDRD